MKKYRIILLLLLAVGIFGMAGATTRFFYHRYVEQSHKYPNINPLDVSSNKNSASPSPWVTPLTSLTLSAPIPTITPVASITPNKILLDVPFTPQAPFAVWDEVHEEICEEAAVFMAVYALDGKSLNPGLAEQEIQSIVAWERDTFGYFEDTNAQQTAKIVTDYYGKKVEITYDFTLDELKKALLSRRPVVVLAAGRLLGNPYYKQPGPVYHAVVIRGFDGDNLITNDPGTKRGERYVYKSSVIMNASHEWVGDPEKITEGRRAMIAIYE